MIAIDEYINIVRETNRLEDIESVLLGFIGEIGSLMSPAKKLSREKQAYSHDKYRKDTLEELGDIFWYFTALSIMKGWKLGILLESLNQKEIDINTENSKQYFTDILEHPTIVKLTQETNAKIREELINFAMCAYEFINTLKINDSIEDEKIIRFLKKYQEILLHANTSFYEVININIEKVSNRFLNRKEPEYFDDDYDTDEKLPRDFEIHVVVKNHKTYMKWNGVRIGDPLSDNHINRDGYKYHDVFHLAYAAILHWSPVIRALIKHKRKSTPIIDEAQDGGRAIVIEEGLTVWLYSQAKEHNYFRDSNELSYDILKTIQQFVKGYEVERCSLKLWEKAILQGYKVFNELIEKGEGKIIGNLKERTIEYRPFS